MDKECLACHSLSPSIPTKVIKNLHTSFCKVNAQNTEEDKITNITKKPKVGNKSKEGNMVPKARSKSKEGNMASKDTSKAQN